MPDLCEMGLHHCCGSAIHATVRTRIRRHVFFRFISCTGFSIAVFFFFFLASWSTNRKQCGTFLPLPHWSALVHCSIFPSYWPQPYPAPISRTLIWKRASFFPRTITFVGANAGGYAGPSYERRKSGFSIPS